MTNVRAPEREQPLAADRSGTTTGRSQARERLANPEIPRNLLAGDDQSGRHAPSDARDRVLVQLRHAHRRGGGNQKARNLAANGRFVLATGSTALPSLDIIIEGAGRGADEQRGRATGHRLLEHEQLAALRPREGEIVWGPSAPTAGPPPYTIFRIVPTKAFGLPGMLGMDKFDPDELPKATRWDFGATRSASSMPTTGRARLDGFAHLCRQRHPRRHGYDGPQV